MPEFTTCLTFAQNQAEEAAHFYLSIFEGGKITNTLRAGDGGPLPKGSVIAVNFELAGRAFIALNGPSNFSFAPGISVFVTCETQDEIDRYWSKLTEGGEELSCGWLTDKFGVAWQIVPKVLLDMINDKDPAKAGRAFQAMMQMKKFDIDTLKRAHADG